MNFLSNTKAGDLKFALRTITIVSILLLDIKLFGIKIFPPASITLALFTMTILAGWWFWKIKKGIGLPRTPISLPIIILFGVAILSTIYSVDRGRSLDTTLAFLTLVLIFFLLCDLILYGWRREIFELSLLIFVGYLLLLGIATIVDHYWSWYLLRVPGYPLVLLRYRLFGVTAHPNLFAMLIYITLPFVIIRLARAKKSITKIIWFIWLLMATIVFYFINSRGGMVAASFALAITLGWILFQDGIPTKGKLKDWLWTRRKIFSGLIAFLAIFLVLTVFFQIVSPQGSTLKHGGGISAGRTKFWQIAFNMFQHNPILGSGLSTYPRFYYQEIPTLGWIAQHSHNLYIDVVAQLGILGIICLLWIIAAIPFLYIRSKRAQHPLKFNYRLENEDLLFGTIAGITGFLIHSIVDVVILTPHTIIPLIILVIIGISSANLIHPGKKLKSRILPSFVGILFLVIVTTYSYVQNNSHQAQINSREHANQNNWQESIVALEHALTLAPNKSFFEEQLGFANGVLSELENDETSLTNALEIYPASIHEQSFWAPHYLNYAILLEKNNENDRAIKILESIPSNWFTTWYFPALILGERLEENGDIENAKHFIRLGLQNRPWVKDFVICKKSFICQEIAPGMFLDDETYSMHEKAINLIEEGQFNEVLQIQTRLNYSEMPALLWIDRAYAHIYLKDYKHARYEIQIADELGAMDNDETRSYMAFVVSEFLTTKGEYDQAEKILTNFVDPMFVNRSFDFFIFKRVGFPDLLLPSLTLLNMNKYDQLIFEKLSGLYFQQGRYSEANSAKDVADTLAEMLDHQ